jgi:hypothetical protein
MNTTPVKDPRERLERVREALVDLAQAIEAEHWSKASQEARYAKALLTQCEGMCSDKIPSKPLTERTKFYRGYDAGNEE